MPVVILPSLRESSPDVCGVLQVSYRAAIGAALSDDGYALEVPTWAKWVRVSIADPANGRRLLVASNKGTAPIASLTQLAPGTTNIQVMQLVAIAPEHGWVWVSMPQQWLRIFLDPFAPALTATLAWSLEFYAHDARPIGPPWVGGT